MCSVEAKETTINTQHTKLQTFGRLEAQDRPNSPLSASMWLHINI
jgi:hypothetical protein